MLIDFDGQFQAYLKTWMRENRSKYRNVDEMESQMPDVYTRWLNTPASWLDGVAPGFYFDRYSDAHQLVALMVDYMDQQVAVPDQLLDRSRTWARRPRRRCWPWPGTRKRAWRPA